MKPIRRLLRATCAAALLGGCAGGDAPADSAAPSPIARDSAGTRVVSNTAPARAPAPWRIGVATTTIGAADGGAGQQLYRVVGATRLSDGSIIIANAGNNELNRYDPDGTFLETIGSEGDGPGHFQVLAWLGRIDGDSLVASDRRLDRVTVFSGTGEYARDYNPSRPANVRGVVAGILADGTLVSRGSNFVPVTGDAGVQRPPMAVWLSNTRGEILAELGSYPGETVDLRPGPAPGMSLRTLVPFGAATLVSAGREVVYIADNARYEVHVLARDGRELRIVRRSDEPLPLRPDDVAAAIDARIDALPPVDEVRAGMRASLEAVAKPDVIPAIRALLEDARGYLWVEAGRHMSDAVAVWSIFDESGAWLMDLDLPAGLELLEVGADYLLARQTDAAGVESVHVIELRRAP